MSYMMSDISLEEKDVVQSIGRRAFLQFTTLDYLISKTYEAIAKIYLDLVHPSWRTTQPPPILKAGFKNPYQLEACVIEQLQKRHLSQRFRPDDTTTLSERIEVVENTYYGQTTAPQKKPPIAEALYNQTFSSVQNTRLRVIDVYKLYNICIVLQRMLSYSILNPRRMYDFRVEQELQKAERSSNIYGTQDDINDKAPEYLLEFLRQKILNELKDANLGLPVEEDIKETIVKMVLHTGHLNSDDRERVKQGLEGGIIEDEIEEKLVHTILPMDYQRLNPPPAPATPTNNVILLEILKDSGLASVIDTLELSLPDDMYAISNSSVLTKLVNTWGTLFTEYQPETVDLLVNTLPTVKDRFRSSITKSESQQDLMDDAFEVIEEFLGKTLTPIRTDDLESLLNNPSANSSLYYFRSLRVLMGNGKFDPMSPIEQWNALQDNPALDTARINFLRLIHWILTDEKELEEIIEYALRLKAVSLIPDGVTVTPTREIQIHGETVIPGVLFPGTLEMTDVLPGGGMLMDMSFSREQKNKRLLQTRLRRSGGLESAVKDARVRWMP